jgi:hypothetical protein
MYFTEENTIILNLQQCNSVAAIYTNNRNKKKRIANAHSGRGIIFGRAAQKEKEMQG